MIRRNQFVINDATWSDTGDPVVADATDFLPLPTVRFGDVPEPRDDYHDYLPLPPATVLPAARDAEVEEEQLRRLGLL